MVKILTLLAILWFPCTALTKGTNVFGIGIYDVKFDGSEKNQSSDLKYEYRSSKSLVNIGPVEDNFFFLKPFFGFEYTTDNASYFLTGIYFEDNLGGLFESNNDKFRRRRNPLKIMQPASIPTFRVITYI